MKSIIGWKKFKNYFETYGCKSLQGLYGEAWVSVRYMSRYCKNSFLLIVLFTTLLKGCKPKENTNTEAVPALTHTPVTVTSVSFDPIEESIELNATSAFLQRSYVK